MREAEDLTGGLVSAEFLSFLDEPLYQDVTCLVSSVVGEVSELFSHLSEQAILKGLELS